MAPTPAKPISQIEHEKHLPYMECTEEQAETALVLEVTVPGVMESKPYRFPLRRVLPEHDDPDISHPMECVDGVTKDGKGMGYDAAIYFKDGSEADVIVHIFLAWTAADQTHGQIDEDVAIPLGQTTTRRLSEVFSIKAYFAPPERQSVPVH